MEDLLKDQYNETLDIAHHLEKKIYARTIDETIEVRSLISTLIGKLKVHLDMGLHYLSNKSTDNLSSLPYTKLELENFSKKVSTYSETWSGPTLILENMGTFITDSQKLFSDLKLLSRT